MIVPFRRSAVVGFGIDEQAAVGSTPGGGRSLGQRRSWALGPSHRSMSGGPDKSPRQASAISTMVGESKWARWGSGESHFWMTRYRPGEVTDAQRSTFRQAGSIRVRTTYLASTGTSDPGSAASKRIVTMVSSTSLRGDGAIRDHR